MFRFGACSRHTKRAHEFASCVIKTSKKRFVNFLICFFPKKKDVRKLTSFLKMLKNVHSSFLQSPFLVLVMFARKWIVLMERVEWLILGSKRSVHSKLKNSTSAVCVLQNILYAVFSEDFAIRKVWFCFGWLAWGWLKQLEFNNRPFHSSWKVTKLLHETKAYGDLTQLEKWK